MRGLTSRLYMRECAGIDESSVYESVRGLTSRL